MSIGIVISVKANLGVTPVSAAPYEFSQITGIRLGFCMTGVYLIFILLQFLILRKDFNPLALLQVICSFLFGFFVTAAEWLTALLPLPQNYVMQLLYLGISIMMIGLGIMLYMTAEILPLPAEGVMEALTVKSGKPLSTSKVLFDCSMVVVALILSFATSGTLGGVREGTLIAAIGVGRFLKVFAGLWKEKLVAVLFETKVELEEKEECAA